MSKKKKFKCAANPKHVEKVKLNAEDVTGVLSFFAHFKVPTRKPIGQYKRAIAKADKNDLHDIAHELLDDLLAAKDAGDPTCNEEMWDFLWPELRKKQEQCRLGTEDH